VNGEKVSLGSLSIRSSRPRAEFSDCDRSQLKQFARSIMQQLDSMQRHGVEEAQAETEVLPGPSIFSQQEPAARQTHREADLDNLSFVAQRKQLEEVTSKLKQHSSFSSNVIHHSLLHAFAVAITPRYQTLNTSARNVCSFSNALPAACFIFCRKLRFPAVSRNVGPKP
jgi:hypothetical protein